MDMLYNETKIRADTYCYEINGGGEFFVQESGKVKIVFENKKFVSASYPFFIPITGTFTRNGWRILAEINKKINDIEKQLYE